MFRTLYARLSAVLVAVFIAIGVIYGAISTSTVKSYLQELTQHFNRDLARRIVADRNLVEEGRLSEKALKSTFSAYMDINPSIEIYLLDLQGRILSFSADPGRVKRQRVDLAPIRAFLDGEGFPLLGDDPRSHDRRKAFSVTPVPSGEALEGYLYVVLQGEQYDSAEQLVQESYVLRLSAWAVAGSLGFGLLAGLLLFHLLTRRLQRLSVVMNAFQESGFTRHEPYAPGNDKESDEIGRLGISFDRMAERMIAQFGELKDQDQLRRELVAQVSHDLRTPLAALHGYLETLQIKGEQLDAEDRREHLDIALRQSTRLTRMVEDLFELAHLEARDARPEPEPCAIAELLQDVLQKFQLSAEQAKVRLGMPPPPNVPPVSADIALTERILDNLVGNALEHTPPEGSVTLELEADKEVITIRVMDTGPGIPGDDIPHLFDPFYRGKGQGAERKHAGLGLAIAKRMVELQDGDLRVNNRPGGGAEFAFTLPVMKL